jgi:hypothetical protein
MPSLMNQNLQDAKKKVIALKKLKKTLLGRDYWAVHHTNQNLQDAKPRSKHTGEDVIYGMRGLIRT